MEFLDSTLPWTGAPVRRSDNLRAYLRDYLPSSSERYLPASMTLFVDPEVNEAAVSRFLQGMTDHLLHELERRMTRQRRFVRLGLLTENEVESFLTDRTDAQPWAIYFSKDGGLGIPRTGFAEAGGPRGVIPCSTMRNHGVAWERDQDGRVRIWLATSRKEGLDWDWESDIGHESAHSAFAPVPFFVQSIPQVADNVLSTVRNVEELKPLHVTQMIYLYSEIAVVAMRGECRPTETGLPVSKRTELYALLQLSAELGAPSSFKRALMACVRANGTINVNKGDEVFEIAAPIMRIIPHLTRFTNDTHPPGLSVFREIVAGASADAPRPATASDTAHV